MSMRVPVGEVARRPAFTLLEIVIVVAILGVLVALLAPAVLRAFGRSTETQAREEIESLCQALELFKVKYGVYPPSRITLHENGAGWSAEDQAALRRIWPRFNFSNTWDLNGDGDTDDAVSLAGWECLVFFLGGVMPPGSNPTDRYGLGFASDPTNPFDLTSTARDTPFFVFPRNRLCDLYAGTAVGANGFPEFVDAFSHSRTASPPYAYERGDRPYAYFSAYGGRGYVATDCADPNEGSRTFHRPDTGTTVTSAGPNPYTMGDPAPAGARAQYWKPDTYQIISAGLDSRYGRGGRFDPEATGGGVDEEDRDNLTNFHAGFLGR